ncbi:biliverdin-producing heme oxygenase [Trinickia sp. NRRL B-1857]|uniref:biliverdin-producing heme oxygenase n=1 Tax=Trinickia sp. NRRL B-1857 TaxID=3162879 RepID=UPI003D2BCA00
MTDSPLETGQRAIAILEPLEAIREATGRRHAALEHAMPLSRQDATLDDYGDHLILLKAWLVPIETWLAEFDDGAQNPCILASIERAPLIDADLSEPSMTPAPAMKAIAWRPRHTSQAYRWGVTYVIEGSQLGGKVLASRLGARLAPHPLRYLGASGAAVGARWRTFIAALQTALTDESQIEEACDGASDAFDALIDIVDAFPINSRAAEAR